MSSTKITAMMILEVLGKPPEHLVETLKKIIEKLKEEKGVEVIEHKIAEPKELEKKEGFFTTFAEVEMEVESPFTLSSVVFKYTPAHVDVMEPEKITIVNDDYSKLLSELTRRLHGYDEVARVMQMENKVLKNKLEKYEGKKD